MQTFLLDAIRTPRGKGNEKGRLHEVKPVVLLKGLFDALAKRAPKAPETVREVILGCVTQVGDQGGNIAQTASLYAGWEPQDSATTVNSFCTSSLSALGLATAKVTAGMGDLYAVGRDRVDVPRAAYVRSRCIICGSGHLCEHPLCAQRGDRRFLCQPQRL